MANEGNEIMKKPLLSVLSVAIALAFTMPVPGSTANAAATTAAATTATTTAAAAKADVTKVAAKKHKRACKVTKKHRCPVRHKKTRKAY